MDLQPMHPTPLLNARIKVGLSSLVPKTHGRSLPQLRAAYPGRNPDELSQALVEDAARLSAAVGGAAACCALVPVPAAAPLATAGESAAVSAVRTRLTAELNTVYGLLDASPVNEGATSHLTQWAARDTGGVVAAIAALPALAAAATRTLPRKLRHRLPTARTPFTATAVAGGLRCGRATRQFGESLRRDLRADPSARSRWSDEPLSEPS